MLILESKCQKSTLHLKVIVVKTYIKRYISLQVHLQSLVLLASFFSTRKLLNYKLYFSTSSCQCVLQKQLLPNKKYYQPQIAVFQTSSICSIVFFSTFAISEAKYNKYIPQKIFHFLVTHFVVFQAFSYLPNKELF